MRFDHSPALAAATLPALLRAAAAAAPAQAIIHLRQDGAEHAVAFAELAAAAERVAAALLAAGARPGAPLVLALAESERFLAGFWGALLAGLAPAPLAGDPARLLAVSASLGRPALLLDAPLAGRLAALSDGTYGAGADWRPLAGFDGAEPPLFLSGAAPDHQPPSARAPQPDDLAYLQFSSGSTGEPRGVELTHAAVLANLRQMAAACAFGAGDTLATWMPYYHDMGLVTAHLLPLAVGARQIKLDALHFARRPALWLEAASRHRATILPAAPFALALITRRVSPEQIAGLDLRAVRLLGVGAEPVPPALCREFLDHLAPAGLDPLALTPMYGLAEATVGVALSPPGAGLIAKSVSRRALAAGQVAEPASDADAVELASLGQPVAGCELRIADERDQPLGPGLIGHIQLRGPQLMRGYHRSPVPAAAWAGDPLDGPWLRTGDLGFLADGRLFVTGRSKEIIIVNGRKHHPADLEQLARATPGLKLREIAVCGAAPGGFPPAGGELVAVFAALRGGWEEALGGLRDLGRRLRQATGAEEIEIIPLAAREFPRTTSGKLQRGQLRQRYEAGEWRELADAVRRALAAAPPAGRPRLGQDAALAAVRGLIAVALRCDPAAIRADDSPLELGASSLQLMEILAALGDAAGVEAAPALLHERPTVAALADWLRAPGALPAPAANPQTAAPPAAPPPGDALGVLAMACRFPGADSPEQFWANLRAGLDSVGPLPRKRGSGMAAPGPAAPAWGSLVDDPARFDAAFFGIDPAEARLMDPQQRILLELAHEALERAGYAGPRRRGLRIGVFAGVGEAGYQELLLAAGGGPAHPGAATAAMRNMIAARIAHNLDLTGPALAIDTACSSALVALHVACASLRAGECDLALVGAANLNLTPTPYQALGRAGALAPGGRCRAFDAAADGIALGEGAGMLLLGPAAKAAAAGDPLLALVRGSWVNNDGQALSPMAPNPLRQAELLRETYARAGVDPASVSYVEAHGTGTAIGDPIEARSLLAAFPPPAAGRRRWLGSVKTNLGHLLNAAGMPALIKVILMLQEREIPPSLHWDQPSPRFDLAGGGFAIPRETRPWDEPGPLRAGVNAFGFGGTNAHVILEEPPAGNPLGAAADPAAGAGPPIRLLTLSARAGRALETLAGDWAASLRGESGADIAAAAREADLRAAWEERAMLIVDTSEPDASDRLAERLERIARPDGQPIPEGARGRAARRRVALLFAGQGAQYPGQGAGLYAAEPVFRAAFDAAAASAGPIAGRTLAEWCFGADVSAAELARTEITQPVLVALEIALARLLLGWGVAPAAAAGHSLGEIAAAHIAGALSLADAMALARERGQLMARHAEPGAMAAVFAPEAAVRAVLARLPDAPAIAALNTPSQTVISGRAAAVEQAVELLAADGFAAVPVSGGYALHSPLVAAAADPLRAWAGGLRPQPASIPLLSTLSADWIGGERLGGAHWERHMLQPVRFAETIERLLADGVDTFVEIGPGSTLSALVRQQLAGRALAYAAEPLLRRGEDDRRALLGAAGRLWVWGVELDRSALAGKEPSPRRAALPAYPYARDRHWLDLTAAALAPALPLAGSQPLRAEPAVTASIGGAPVSEVLLSPAAAGWRLELRGAAGQPLLELPELRFAPLDGPAASQSALPGNQLSGLPDELPASQSAPPGAQSFARPDKLPAGQSARAGGAGGDQPHPTPASQSTPVNRPPVGQSIYPAEQRSAAPTSQSDPPAAAGDLRHAPQICRVAWRPSPLPPASAWRRAAEWLIINDGASALGPMLAARMADAGEPARLLDPAAADQALENAAGAGIIWLGAGRVTAGDEPDQGALLRLLACARRIAELPADRQPLGLWVATAGAWAAGDAPVDPSQALAAGLAHALPDQRLPAPCVAVDLDPAEDPAAWAESLGAETAVAPLSGVWAWRGGQRLSRRLEPLAQLPAPLATNDEPAGRMIVIAGGAGGLGAALARHLAGRNQPRLVLLGRRAPSGQQQELIRDLCQRGAAAEYRQADIADSAQVERLLAALIADHGAIHGLIQAAGVLEPGSLRGRSADSWAAVLAPKVRGTWLLARGLARHGQRPAFFIACSSIAAVLPGWSGGMADYAAANAFLDSFAAAERLAGRPLRTLNWAAWADTGMAARPPLGERLRSGGLAPLTREQALLAFDLALAAPDAQLAILPPVAASENGAPRWRASQPAEPATNGAPLSDGWIGAPLSDGWNGAGPSSQPPTPSGAGRPAAAAPSPASPAGPDGELAAALRQLVAGALKTEPARVPLDGTFLSLGLDSLQAVDLVKRLEQAAGLTLPMTLFFEFQTVSELARHLAGLAPDLAARLRDAGAPPGGGFPAAPTSQSDVAGDPAPPPLPEARSAPGQGADGAQAGTEPFRLTPPQASPAAAPGDGLAAAPAGSEPFGLTPPQLAFYVGAQLYPERPAFALVRQRLAGPADPAMVRAAFEALLVRHPMLRAEFAPPGDSSEPSQRALPADALPASAWFALRGPEAAASLADELAGQRFELDDAPLFRVALCGAGGAWELFVLVHHAIADGWSLRVILEECWQIYAGLARGLTPSQAAAALPLPASFADYAALLRSQAAGPGGERDRAWWAERFRERPAALAWSLPDDQPGGITRPADAPAIAVINDVLDAAATAAARERAAAAGVTLFHWLIAAYARRLARWRPDGSRSVELALNVADHGRAVRLPGIERMVGSCADQLPVLLEIDPAGPLEPLAAQVRDFWLDAQRHRAVSALDLARLLPQRGPGLRQPGAATFSFASFPLDAPAGCPVSVESLSASAGSAATRLTLVVGEIGGELHCAWLYLAAALDGATVAALAADYRRELLEAAPPANVSGAAPGEPQPVLERILGWCERQPAAVAVKDEEGDLTYGELAARSARLAAWLGRENGGGRPIGLLMAPGAAAIAGIVGILRSGAAWVPLNAEYPPAQLAAMLEQTGAGLVLCHQPTAALADQLGGGIRALRIEELPEQIEARATRILPGQPAYIIFTSGSTGGPKGVPVTQRAIANYVDWLISAFEYAPADRLLQTAALSFGAAVSQILGPLAAGATVIPLPRALVRDPEALLARIEQEQPTIWRSVPSLWERLLAAIERRIAAGLPAPELAALRWIGVGGEPLPASHVRRWMAIYGARHRIANHYGPSEATINATCHVVDEPPPASQARIPIGRPIQGAIARVLGPDGRLAPPGADGELGLGGVCLSPGYLGRPGLTAERFVPDPLAPGERLYRTGDLVRPLPGGALDFLGRIDDQIKLRGFRIEPGEIEAALLQHPAIARAAVCALEESGETVLAAFLETRAPLPPEAELRRWLRALLPPQMVPHRFQSIPALPTVPSGKIDRRKLAAWAGAQPAASPGDAAPPADGAEPATATERLLAAIWREVLGVASVGRHDDFFELGGDSLRTLQVLARLRAAPGGPASLPRAAVLYERRTLADLARALDDHLAGAETPAVAEAPGAAAPPDPSFPLSPAQAGFLLAETAEPETPATWCARLEVAGPLDLAALERALNLLVRRHPMLRVIFPAGERRQREIEPPAPLAIALDDLTEAGGGEDPAALADAIWREERARRFDLAAWPLLRMRVLRLGAERHIWLISAHHIIGDGWSAWIFGQDLLRLYDRLAGGLEPELPPLGASFREVAMARQAAAGPAAADHWRAVFAEPYRAPERRRSPAARDAEPATFALELGAAQAARLRTIAAGERISPYVLWLALFARQLQAASASGDVVIGTALSGRELPLPDIDRLFGCFATALPLRIAGSQADGGQRAVGAAFQAAYANALPPLEIARCIPAHTPPLTALGGQYFFTFLDFDALGPLRSERLAIDWAASETDLAAPAAANELLLAVRVLDGACRLALRAAPGSWSAAELASFARGMLAQLDLLAPPGGPSTGGSGNGDGSGAGMPGPASSAQQEAAQPQSADAIVEFATSINAVQQEAAPRRSAGAFVASQTISIETSQSAGAPALTAANSNGEPAAPAITFSAEELSLANVGGLDAALIGYLPPSQRLAPLLGLSAGPAGRELLRQALFPGGRPRWIEALETPIGRSGFICLPWFAEELAGQDGGRLAESIIAGMELAGSLGARCVSLAGMLPARTGYGFEVLRRIGGRPLPRLTTGHATTAVAVVRTLEAALAASGARLGGAALALLGLGSIGRTALALLLRRLPATFGAPRRLILCDLAGQRWRLEQLADELRGTPGWRGEVAIAEAGPAAPAELYQADIIVAATSTPGCVDAALLRPGAILVDDSFPPCLDTAAAIRRMREAGDVLVVGGGLLDCGPSRRIIHLPAGAERLRAIVSAQVPARASASCQLESLLQAADPALPLIHGLVGEEAAERYWQAVPAAGFGAAPLHLEEYRPDPAALALPRA